MTAPGPVLGILYEAAFHGIEVHVVHLFVFLSDGEHVEVVEAALPKASML